MAWHLHRGRSRAAAVGRWFHLRMSARAATIKGAMFLLHCTPGHADWYRADDVVRSARPADGGACSQRRPEIKHPPLPRDKGNWLNPVFGEPLDEEFAVPLIRSRIWQLSSSQTARGTVERIVATMAVGRRVL